MKHLLTGAAMAAALAIAAPAWAQTPAPMTPGGNNPTSGSAGPFAPAPAAAAPATPAAAPAQPMGARGGKSVKHYMHHIVRHNRAGSGDQTTEQLNAQELQRITSGGPAPMAPAPMTPGGNNPTSGSAGPFAPMGSAPPPPPK
jgi:hypothetical protein